MRLIGIRSLPLLQIFYISLTIPLGSTDFAVLFWLGQLEGNAEHRVAGQVGTARDRIERSGYKLALVSASTAGVLLRGNETLLRYRPALCCWNVHLGLAAIYL